MQVHYVYLDKKRPIVETLGDDDIDRARQLLQRGCTLVRTPIDAIIFEERLDIAFQTKHLTDIFGPGTITAGVYIPFQQERE